MNEATSAAGCPLADLDKPTVKTELKRLDVRCVELMASETIGVQGAVAYTNPLK
jgi:hypothetical protein